MTFTFTPPHKDYEVVLQGTVTWLNPRQQHPVHSLPPGLRREAAAARRARTAAASRKWSRTTSPATRTCSTERPPAVTGLALAVLAAVQAAAPAGNERVFERTKASVVTVEVHSGNKDAKNALGSGYLVSAEGLIVTNYHVVSRS